MAEDVKTVGVKWEVDFKQLTNAEKAQQRYVTNLKKMNQMHGTIVRSSMQVDQAMQRQTQALGLLGEGINQTNEALLQQAQILESEAERTQQRYITNLKKMNQIHGAIVRSSQQVRESTQRQTGTVKKNTIAWGRGIKRLALYAIGAASVFRIVMKLRRAFDETVETLFKNTEEYQKMKEAQDDLKAAFLAFLGTEESFKQYFENVSDWIDQFVDGLIKARAGLKAFQAYIQEVNKEAMEDPRFRGGGGPPIPQRVSDEERIEAETNAWEVYNREVEEGRARVEEWGNAITEARESGEDATDKLTDAQKRYQRLLEQLVRAEEQRIRDLIDLYDDYERKLQDIIETTNRALADLALEGTRRREDIELTYQRRLEDIERSTRENRARNEERLRLKLLRIEMRYRERLIRIQEDFDDSMYDAIAKRDATAALLAIRRRDREQGRALRERNNAIALAQAEYNSQIRLQRQSLERMREDARIARQRALEDLAVDLARERQDIQTNHDRELEDLDTFLRRRRADIERDYEWQVTRAQAHYAQDEQMYARHLQNRLSQLQAHYLQVIAMYNTYAGALASPDMPVGGATTYTGAIPGFAEGGVGLFTRPTRIDVAERGPEIIIAQPVSSSDNVSVSGIVQHQISGSIAAAMEGFEGRLGAVITEQVVRVMGEML